MGRGGEEEQGGENEGKKAAVAIIKYEFLFF